MVSESLINVVVVSSVAVSVLGTVSIAMSLVQMIVAVVGASLTEASEVSMRGPKRVLATMPVGLIDGINLLLGENAVVSVVKVIVQSGMIVEVPSHKLSKKKKVITFVINSRRARRDLRC